MPNNTDLHRSHSWSPPQRTPQSLPKLTQRHSQCLLASPNGYRPTSCCFSSSAKVCYVTKTTMKGNLKQGKVKKQNGWKVNLKIQDTVRILVSGIRSRVFSKLRRKLLSVTEPDEDRQCVSDFVPTIAHVRGLGTLGRCGGY